MGRAVVLVVLAVIVAVVLLDRIGSSGSSHPSAAGSTTTTTLPRSTSTTKAPHLIPASSIHLQVLNGLISGDVSSEFSNALKTYGYITAAPNDTTHVVDVSAVYVATAGYYAEAEALARRVGLPITAIQTATPTAADGIPAAVLSAGDDLILVVGQALATSGPPGNASTPSTSSTSTPSTSTTSTTTSSSGSSGSTGTTGSSGT